VSLSVEGDALHVSVPADGVYTVSMPGAEGKSLQVQLTKDVVHRIPTEYFE
jgi:hypothetical protein